MESRKYIKTLFHVAKMAFAFGSCRFEDYYIYFNQCYNDLKKLNFDKMFDESFEPNAKEKFHKWVSDDENELTARKLREEAHKMNEELINCYWDCNEEAFEYHFDGILDDEYYKKLNFVSNQVVFHLWPKRIKQLSDAYDLNIRIKDFSVRERTNGRPKGSKKVESPAFNDNDLKNGHYFNGVSFDFKADNIVLDPIISRSIHEEVIKNPKHLEDALLKADPCSVSNKNRLDALYLVFMLFAKAYVVKELKDDYISKVKSEFLKMKQINDFSKFSPNEKKEIMKNIWYEVKDKNKKVTDCGFK